MNQLSSNGNYNYNMNMNSNIDNIANLSTDASQEINMNEQNLKDIDCLDLLIRSQSEGYVDNVNFVNYIYTTRSK